MFGHRMSLIFVSLFLMLVLGVPRFVFADSASDIQNKIDANNRQLESLKAEIAAFQEQLNVLGTKKNTLQSTINSLAISQKQLTAQIQATQNKITSANLEIQKLSLSIRDKETSISSDQSAIGKALQNMAQNEQTPLIAELISSDSLTDAWKKTDAAIQFNRALKEDIADLRSARKVLSDNRNAVAAEKAKLISLQNDLAVQKRSVDASKTAQQKLLADTKNQESLYQKQIAEKQAAEKAFEQELASLQSQLNLIVHPGLLPKTGTGILSWPYSVSYMATCVNRSKIFGNLFCITQFFGNTAFSTANPQVYNGNGHNGIDISSPIGMPLYASMGGKVLGTGNTDLIRGCYSFGKWVMVDHGNGLNTLYSHLSEIDVAKGQQVSRGQLIGLSGMTGFATGPHLHFGVYATEGTQIMSLKQFRASGTACASATMPVATISAYLNPLSYL